MTKTEDAAVHTTVSDTELQEGLAGGTAHGAAAAPQKASQKSTFVILSDYVLEMPMKVRLPVYNKVSAAVRDGELFGLMHATNQVDILLLDAKNKEVTRSFRQVLVSNSAAVLERLEEQRRNDDENHHENGELNVESMVDLKLRENLGH